MRNSSWKETMSNSPLFKLDHYDYQEYPKATLKNWLYGYFDKFSLVELNSINKDSIDMETEKILTDYVKEKYD